MKKELKTIAEILERHYDNADVMGDLSLGDLEDDLEFNRTQAQQQERERIFKMVEKIEEEAKKYPMFSNNKEQVENFNKGYDHAIYTIIHKIKELK